MVKVRSKRNKAFSLLEMVIVVVIIGIIAAIAIPRMSRGAAGASESAVIGDLAVLRNAIDMFAAEHNGAFPTVAAFEGQLTLYTDGTDTGGTPGAKDATHIYGPYLRKLPKLPTGNQKGDTAVASTNKTVASPPSASGDEAGSGGWLYNATTGDIWANDVNHFDK